ncbi:MAG: tRNA-dihydrouridine synthase family protein [Proteobacteria bacterium]|nr:tRNA-dihydrouridine synthase family protein [Pseudomonadota bacterium]
MQLYLAPLQGFTDRVFRNSYFRFFSGFDCAMAPFISALQLGHCKKKELMDVLPEHNGLMKVIPQIMGNDPSDFAVVANLLFDMGYPSVNWNLGCPYKMLTKKKKGSGLLCYPERVEDFLDRVFPLMKTRLSIKMRLGLHDKGEILALMPILNRYTLDEITIHPRTGAQMYEGGVDLDAFGDACAMSRHTIVYNGDIRSREDFERISARFGFIERWMIGRGVLADPFLPMTIKGECDRVSDKIKTIKQFHDDYYQERLDYLSGPAHVTDRMKAFWSYLAPSLEGGTDFFKQVKKVKTPEHYTSVVENFFERGTCWNGPSGI